MTKLYRVTEISKTHLENYTVKMEKEELKKFLKTKREAYGYIEGVGGDKSYDCFAIEIIL